MLLNSALWDFLTFSELLYSYTCILNYASMIGSAIGAGLSIASAIAGGISSAKKNREAKELQERERRRNREWYDAEMAKDYTMRADYQNVLRRQREMYNERLNNLAASQAVTGASDASVAAEKEAINKAVADTTSNMAAMSEQAKDRATDRYLDTESQLRQQQIAGLQQEGANISQAASAGIQAGANIGGALDEGGLDKALGIGGGTEAPANGIKQDK